MLTQDKEKYREVLQVAEKLNRQNPDWVTFFREVLGIEGVVRTAFPTHDALAEFEQSEEFDAIQQILVKLREKRASADADNEPTRVITVRLPKSMHEYLRTEAHDLRTSMNKLCISKLLQVICEDKIPNERSSGTPSRAASPPSSNGSLSGESVSNGLAGGQTTTDMSPFTQPIPQQKQTPPPYKPANPRF
ncbi:hypothetical protein HG15A2_17110 [Adhaeretor mobilis]|uniref:Uncharacterized protein n=2 Tax=Adhaeretor mobilis TaxID=1930276 RepID=A0A517MU75_9BACT|nr:hypothetical protein HG15A2_17110 [Adhaeretor mobilis]